MSWLKRFWLIRSWENTVVKFSTSSVISLKLFSNLVWFNSKKANIMPKVTTNRRMAKDAPNLTKTSIQMSFSEEFSSLSVCSKASTSRTLSWWLLLDSRSRVVVSKSKSNEVGVSICITSVVLIGSLDLILVSLPTLYMIFQIFFISILNLWTPHCNWDMCTSTTFKHSTREKLKYSFNETVQIQFTVVIS